MVRYNPASDDWSKLPKPPASNFAMTTFNDRLVLVGGVCSRKRGGLLGWFGSSHTTSDRVTVWDDGRREWIEAYTPMPTPRSLSAALGYQKYLIVACGLFLKDEVEVLDSSTGRWHKAQPVPWSSWAISSTAIVGDCWYISSHLGHFTIDTPPEWGWEDGKQRIVWVHLPTLISNATSGQATTGSIWNELPEPPVEYPSLVAFKGHLLLVGGKGCAKEIHRYNSETGEWNECGQLPVGLYGACCAELPSGELMVVGGKIKDAEDEEAESRKTWIGKIEN